jgi:hypothetical protein
VPGATLRRRRSLPAAQRRVCGCDRRAEGCAARLLGADFNRRAATSLMSLLTSLTSLTSLTRRTKFPTVGTACPMEPPVGSLVRARQQRPKDLQPWGAANFSELVFHHSRLFVPKNAKPPDGWIDGIYASQNPANCTRFLLLENDVSHAGLGMQARFILQALLLAVRDQRVLLEIPSSHPNRSKLWCDCPPYTFECVFEPWSYCPAPDLERAKAAGQITSPKVRFPYGFWDTNLPVAKVGIDWIRKSQRLWQGRTTWFSGDVHGVVSKVLFRPRPWVRRLSKCTMREYGLVERRFAALHIRESVEKQKELGKKLPSYASYETIAETMMHEYNVSHLFLQTASPGALSELTRWAHATRTVLAFTHNPRGEHDSWAGWKSGRQMLEATIAAVNLHIASKAIVFVGIASSMWNYVQLPLLGSGGKPKQIDVKCSDSVWKITVATRADTLLRVSDAACSAQEKRNRVALSFNA